MRYRTAVIILSVAIIFGAAIRIFHPVFCPTADEGVTLRHASQSIYEIMMWALGGDYNPPGYYMLVSLVANHILHNVTLETVRIPALIFGILVIPSMYFLGTKLGGDVLGVLAATASSVLFPYIYYSQNARAYTMVMFFFIWFVWCFVEVYRNPSRRGYLLLTIAAILCLCSHFYSAIPIAVAMAILLVKTRSKELIACLLVSAFFIVVIFNEYIPVVINHMSVYASVPHTIYWIGPVDIAIMLPNELLGWSWILFIPLLILSLRNYNLDVARPIVLIALVTCISCLPMTIFTAMLPRYALLVSPLLVCVASIPLATRVEAMSTEIKKAVSVCVFAFAMFLFNYGSIVVWNSLDTCKYIV